MKTKQPQTIALELSSQCGLNCFYCDRQNWDAGVRRNRPHMDLGLFGQLVDEISEMMPQPQVSLSFEGESTLHPEFIRMLEYLNEKKIRPWITIRAKRAGKPELNALIQRCSAVSVSMELNETAIGIKFVGDIIDLANPEINDIELSVNHTLCPPDHLESPGVVKFIETFKEKVHEVYIWNKIDFGASITHSDIQGIERHLERRRICKQPFSFLAVLSDGRVSPCCVTSRTVFRTIDASNGIAAVLKSEEYRHFLNDHENMNLGKYICGRCDLWLDDWLADEKGNIKLSKYRTVEAHFEGATVRIEGGLRNTEYA